MGRFQATREDDGGSQCSQRSSATNRSSMVPHRLPPPDEPLEGLQRIGCFMGGVADDYRRRLPLYWSDIVDGIDMKTISSALFMFFATFFSTVALGVIIQDNTDKKIGTEEFLLMNSIAGMLHAVFGCQPMLVLRPTGPITAIITTLYTLSKTVDVDFHQYLAATGIFVGVYMIIIAGLELSRWIRYLTRYTHEIFAFFVCSIYIHDGVAGVVKDFHISDNAAAKKSFYLLVLALLTFGISMILNSATRWSILTPKIRELLSEYAVTIAVFATIGLSYAQLFGSDIGVDRVEMPDSIFSPTYEGRSWLVSFSGMKWSLFPLAAASALPIVFFFYMDQNVSSLYTQMPEMKVEKGAYYHSSFFCMGLFNVFAPALGFPFVTGSLPHSPQFVRAVACYDESGKITRVKENRIAPFIMYLLIGVPVAIPQVLEKIPKACVDGILVFVGVAGLVDTQLFERLGCLFCSFSRFPRYSTHLTLWEVNKWTLSQLLLLALCWGVNLSPAALLFSVIVVSIVPVRRYILPRLYQPDRRDIVLEILDSPNGSGDDHVASAEKESCRINAKQAPAYNELL